MPVSRKILIRVIGAPLLVAALCGIIYWGHTLQSQGRQNTPLQVLLLGPPDDLPAEGDDVDITDAPPLQG